MCGGADPQLLTCALEVGLSPRVRGSRRRGGRESSHGGSIPACAGEPGHGRGLYRRGGVYPRVCGGAYRDQSGDYPGRGLSPRVRGSLPCRQPGIPDERSIPACAGEPDGRLLVKSERQVYPRVCGGAPGQREHLLGALGLSPRVRGSRRQRVRRTGRIRSIPACAGEPATQHNDNAISWVYPRVCGGAIGPLEFVQYLLGLSPRVRGSHDEEEETSTGRRSIPACAGEPLGPAFRFGPHRVYPRVCGGADCGVLARREHHGLSPRVRGSHTREGGKGICPGSIPACAGEPWKTGSTTRPSRVYPRVCGGALYRPRGGRYLDGLSPRVRGSHILHGVRIDGYRSIPACAGEPGWRPAIS